MTAESAEPVYTCLYPGCGSTDVRVDRRDSPDKPIGISCRTCGQYTWPPKPENEKKRRDNNAKHRKRWRSIRGGELRCMWCWAVESQKRGEFQIDHIWPREKSHDDSFENSMPLCAECHVERHAHQRTVQHLLGRSAREWDPAE